MPTSYFGPPPSEINRELVGPVHALGLNHPAKLAHSQVGQACARASWTTRQGINLGRWTLDAVRRGYRSRLIDEFQLLAFVRRGHITGPAGARYGSVGIRVNCPIVHRFLL